MSVPVFTPSKARVALRRDTAEDLKKAVVRAQVSLPPENYTAMFPSSEAVYLRLLYLAPEPEDVLGRGARWILTLGPGVDAREEMVASRSTFERLYEMVHVRTGLLVGQPPEVAHMVAHWAVSVQMLHDLLVTSYDTTDEVEAAEQTLVGLGATPTVFPRILTSP